MRKAVPRRFEPKRDPHGGMQLFIDGCKLALWVPWALVWGGIGTVLCVLMITIPLGVVCFGIGAWPLKRMVETRNNRIVAWEEQALEIAMRNSTHEEGLPPWLMDGEDDVW